ncbi:putative oxidoreductase ucpA [Mollisia scopiformis]|uniref:Putative oxidoreductase ucpA n=1 Tax=Mollisia scopiformis TaxID=149040 RepID=A0A194WSX0_MOLSC|nr:putative oxidoreductase ucpA [Mollisia scopiformis]KUJ11055.1 putative oxidoreductase ucpA [Mollisia scopiformis]
MAIPAYLGVTYITPIHHNIYPSIDPTSHSLAQPEKVVLITGASKGIGRSIALSYAKANVACLVLVSRTASDLDRVVAEIKALNTEIRVRTFAVDATSEDGVQRVKDEVIKEEGRLDVLVNNAGASTPWVPIPESPASDYWRTFEINVKSPFLFLHAFLPLLKETGEKTGKGTDIINVSSIGAHATMPGASAYQVSKLALLRLSEFVDVEFGQNGAVTGVRCVAIHPGGVKTDLTANSSEAVKSSLVDTPELAGGFCVWLTSEDRAWLRGRYLSVSWDVDELEKKREEIEGTDKLKMRMVL